MNTGTLAEGTIVGFGDPLLDITADVDLDFLKRFGLKQDDSILAGDSQRGLPKELCERYTPRFSSGGSTQNTLRVMQWILRQPRISTMVGAIGYDQYGRYLEQNARECGVDIRYHYVEQESTGTCCVLLSQNGIRRSLITTKGASARYSIQHLQRIWEPVVERARFFYVTCYFLSGNAEVVLEVAHHSHQRGKVLCLNLSASFLMALHREKICSILPYVDIVFGNDSELEAFIEAHYEPDQKLTREEAARFLSTFMAPPGSPRLAVITQAENTVLVAKGSKLDSYTVDEKVIDVDSPGTVDTNGAGDAFVGGFLASLIKSCSVEVCVKNGCMAALAIIHEVGCTTPDRSKVRFYSGTRDTEPRIPSITRRQISIS
ncbi:adenosine kinase 2-like isoform X1 [Varroa destructor]|uniref:Adenosine kinase n=1 Tax=Varroa destructor TaxID=109461 RepID=A0A7M7KSH9_VARDE|nr:adenosine kinase 2-like isoform X1 [Varroa destructor]